MKVQYFTAFNIIKNIENQFLHKSISTNKKDEFYKMNDRSCLDNLLCHHVVIIDTSHVPRLSHHLFPNIAQNILGIDGNQKF